MSFIFTSISLLVMLQFNMPTNPELQTKGFTLEELPEYVVVGSAGTRSGRRTLFLFINSKRSKYERPLSALEDYLSNKLKLAVTTQSDLLTAMSELGFDYINAYQIGTDDVVNVVFRKKEAFRE